MRSNETHLSDEELLLFADQELSLRQAARARRHIAQCGPCRGRLTAFDDASASFADLHEREVRARSRASSNSRELLQARLSEVAGRTGGSPSANYGFSMLRQLAAVSVALLLVIGSAWTARQLMRTHLNPDSAKAESLALPLRTLTPGSARAVQVAELCGGGDPDNDPPVNPSLEQAVLREYGVPASAKKDYDLDYLITPALGGAESLQNLWPQPNNSPWNARVKDQLEDHLHGLVCQGKVQLETAQSDIASDWIAAYKKYFNTDKPQPGLSTAAGLSPDRGWNPNRRSRPAPMLAAVDDLALSEDGRWDSPLRLHN